jgi:hypothetical protein
VLVDPSRLDDCFVALDYFESIQLPHVVAVNQFAGRASMTIADVRHAVNVEPDVPVVPIDARSREAVKSVVLTLLHLILARAKSRISG